MPKQKVPKKVPGDACAACGTALHLMGIEQFRVGGTSGGWKLLFGEWAELGEQMLPLEVWACSKCRRVELRAAPETDTYSRSGLESRL